MKKVILAVLLVFSLSVSPAVSRLTAQAHAKGHNSKEIAFQMLAVNDFHGNLNTVSDIKDNGKMYKVGGAAYLASHLNQAEQDMNQQAKKEGLRSYTIRLHAGDLVGASPPISALLQDQPTAAAFNAMNFKIGVLGNHEFDEGIPELKRLLYAASVHPNVKKYTKGFDYRYKGIDKDFDYLCANVVDKKTGKPIFPPYAIKNAGGVKVGFIGIDTLETMKTTLHKNIKDFKFLNEADTVNKYVKILHNKGVHAIAVDGHIPADNKDGKIVGDAADLAKKVSDDVDVIFAGHNNTNVNGFVDGKLIVEDLKYGQAYGDVRGKLDPKTQDFVKGSLKASVVPNTRDIKPDPKIQSIVNQAKTITDKVTKSPIGYAADGKTIGKKDPEEGEDPLGDLITDGQREMTGAQIAFTNSGGIRTGLVSHTNTKGLHEVSWGDAYAVQPFANQLGVYQLTGKQMKAALNEQWQNPDHMMFMQDSGIKYTYADGDKVPGCHQKYCVKDMYLSDGEKIAMDKTYTVALNEFLATGGDGFSAFKQGKLVKPYQSDTDTFIEYLKKLTAEGKKLDPKVDGRATLAEPSKAEQVNALNGDDRHEQNQGKTSSSHSKAGHKLPDTATNIYSYLLAGIILAALGLMVLFYRRKRT
ncbi:5'-nucleotidase [Scopulibacillus daqui]|uniref:5'-nucleotidase n=1 Tax=Scopulibacillus daqui TaxID=1469162 RepID=A0ABS2PX69_9BACL|nr:5'-nucleotidase C-terminal domain-containing protein [Scopulibacillus daqui]MBM7644558.1 5'-nucleotidase [Scopulibacillus daqui]